MEDNLSTRIRSLRGEKSQDAFSQEIGISLRSYKYYESGERIPPVRVLSKMARVSGRSLNWILTGEEKGIKILEARSIYIDPLREAILKRLDKMSKKDKEDFLRYAEFLEVKKKREG